MELLLHHERAVSCNDVIIAAIAPAHKNGHHKIVEMLMLDWEVSRAGALCIMRLFRHYYIIYKSTTFSFPESSSESE